MIPRDTDNPVDKLSEIDELSGKLAPSGSDDKLMRSILDHDASAIEDGKLLTDGINQGMSGFTPDLFFEQLVKHYKMAKQIYGESIIRALTGDDADFVEKNKHIPEYQRELKKKIEKKVEHLKEEKLIDRFGAFSEDGYRLASLVTYTEELDLLQPKAGGEKQFKKIAHYGEKQDVRNYHKGDRYKDIAIKHSIKKASRRGHNKLLTEDLSVFDRENKGLIQIVYAIDASGSMKGKKIGTAKRSGIALAFKAIEQKDEVGLIVFGADIISTIRPTKDFMLILKELIKVRASKETDIATTINKSVELFAKRDITKHLIIITDALPTVGEMPEKETIEAATVASLHGITISVVGINLDSEGLKLAEKITDIGKGRLYATQGLDNMDKIILGDYYALAESSNIS